MDDLKMGKLWTVLAEARDMTMTDQYMRFINDMIGKSFAGYDFIFCGVGKNWYVAEKETKTWISMGLNAKALDPVHALHGDMGMVGTHAEVIFCISKSGTTSELTKFVKILNGIKSTLYKQPYLVLVTMNPDIEPNIEDMYDFVIKPSPGKQMNYEFDDRDLVPTVSILATQMILDDLGVQLFEANPKLVERYKYNHMGGANGKLLGMEKEIERIENE